MLEYNIPKDKITLSAVVKNNFKHLFCVLSCFVFLLPAPCNGQCYFIYKKNTHSWNSPLIWPKIEICVHNIV